MIEFGKFANFVDQGRKNREFCIPAALKLQILSIMQRKLANFIDRLRKNRNIHQPTS